MTATAKPITQPITQPQPRRFASLAFKDARDYQILFLTLFLSLGIATRDWTLRPQVIVTAIATTLLTQWLCDRGQLSQKRPFNWRSPLITALGLSLLLRVNHWSTMALATGVAIASKTLFRIQGKHFFNPGNLGIITVLVFTSNAWVSPGQWGEEVWYAFLFAGAGGIVLKRVGRLETTVAFLGSYAGLEALRNLWLGWTWDVWFHRLTNGSLLLFALFMITDPRSIPNTPTARWIWASAIALLTFILRNVFFLPTALFWSLFLLSPLTPLLDRLWSGDRFEW